MMHIEHSASSQNISVGEEMSDPIYDNEEINRERVEMIVDIYESVDFVRDHDFRTETKTHQPLQHTESDCVKIRSYRAAVVCLVLLCVLLLTAVIVLFVHIHTNNTNYTEDIDELLTKITNLTKERDQLQITIKELKTEKDQLVIQKQKVTKENEELLSKNDDLLKQKQQLQQKNNDLRNSLRKIGGCMYYQSSIYFMSSEKKSWSESREDCKDREADLIIINNKEEQDLVKQMSVGARVWIGLTDSVEEGSWKWVDGSTPTFKFWGFREPNGHIKENCVGSLTSGWADYQCDNAFKSICEKNFF